MVEKKLYHTKNDKLADEVNTLVIYGKYRVMIFSIIHRVIYNDYIIQKSEISGKFLQRLGTFIIFSPSYCVSIRALDR